MGEVALEKLFLGFLSFLLLVIILPPFHTYLSLPPKVCNGLH
jgi:hypothetical protein